MKCLRAGSERSQTTLRPFQWHIYNPYHIPPSPRLDRHWPQSHIGRLGTREHTVPRLAGGVFIQRHSSLQSQLVIAPAVVRHGHLSDPVRVGEEGWHGWHQQPAKKLYRHGYLWQKEERVGVFEGGVWLPWRLFWHSLWWRCQYWWMINLSATQRSSSRSWYYRLKISCFSCG